MYFFNNRMGVGHQKKSSSHPLLCLMTGPSEEEEEEEEEENLQSIKPSNETIIYIGSPLKRKGRKREGGKKGREKGKRVAFEKGGKYL